MWLARCSALRAAAERGGSGNANNQHRENALKALLIDDHPLILSAMQAVMGRIDNHWEVVGAETGREMRERLASHPDIDLVLLDLVLGDADGFELLSELRRDHPSLPVVVVSASERPQDVMRAITEGAMGYVPKRASNDLLAEALHLVMSGGVYVPPLAQLGAAEVLSEPSRSATLDADGKGWDDVVRAAAGSESARTAASTAPMASAFDSLGLTARQREVLGLLLQGKPNKAIAAEMGLSVETVKDHVQAVLRCLGVNSRTQAVLAVAQLDGGRGAASLLRGG
ncbi:MAG: response regulator transcription factor [Burkholderiales bacterium]